MNYRTFIFIFFLFTVLADMQAQDKSIQVDISNDTIYLGNSLLLTYSMKNLEGNFMLPELDSCHVSLPSTRSMTTIINGRMKSSKIYRYQVLPLNTGRFTIPSVKIEEAQDTFQTVDLSIIVLADPDKPQVKSLPVEHESGNKNIGKEDAMPREEKTLPPKRNIIHL